MFSLVLTVLERDSRRRYYNPFLRTVSRRGNIPSYYLFCLGTLPTKTIKHNRPYKGNMGIVAGVFGVLK